MKNNKITNYLVLAALMTVLLPCALFAAFKDSGWGVRPLGMAGAFTAVADDSNAPLYNPAGLARVKQEEFSLMSAKLYSGLNGVDIGLNYLSYVRDISDKYGGFGIAWAALASPTLYREDTVSLGYGRVLNDVVKMNNLDDIFLKV